jgi:hypothetical protein
MSTSLLVLLTSLALIALIRFLRWRADQNPRKAWVYLLWGLQIGPKVSLHVDVPRMSRKDLMNAGLRATTWGLIFMSVFAVNGILMEQFWAPNDAPGFFVVVMFLSALFWAMGIAAGLYLLLRGALRSSNYVPPTHE